MSTIEKASDRLVGSAKPGGATSNTRAAAGAISAVVVHGAGKGAAGIAPERAAGRAAAVELDLERLSSEGYLTPASMVGRLAEQYRALKRPLLKSLSGDGASADDSCNTLVVTSALPGEGKTFTVFNLAMSIAMERDISVLLIDADLTRRSLSALVGLASAPGLGDVLVERELDVADVIVKTNVPKLSLIPAGQAQQYVTELLSSGQMRRVIRELADRYKDRIILMDSAPVLGSSQATALCDLAGQILFVVEEGKTSQHSIRDAIALLDRDKPIGLVLNKSIRFSNNEYSPYYGEY
jgi:protein-tyrosine kinase